MKSRSEMLKARSSVETKKPTAAERTVAMFKDDDAKDENIHCGECDEDNLRSAFSTRDDGLLECPSCAMPVEATKKTKRAPEASLKQDAVVTKPSKKVETGGPKNPHLKYCGQCGAEWPIVDAKFWINCGHMTAERIEHPSKATKPGPPAGLHGRSENVEMKPNGVHKVSHHESTVTVSGNRVSVTWGEASFEVSSFNRFRVGSFIASSDILEGETMMSTAKRLLGELEQLADVAFKTQKTWYEKKLGLLQ